LPFNWIVLSLRGRNPNRFFNLLITFRERIFDCYYQERIWRSITRLTC
jgi:hypothetical protein